MVDGRNAVTIRSSSLSALVASYEEKLEPQQNLNVADSAYLPSRSRLSVQLPLVEWWHFPVWYALSPVALPARGCCAPLI